MLVEHCDQWHISDIANSRDGPMNSITVLRRNLVSVALMFYDGIGLFFGTRMSYSDRSSHVAITIRLLTQDSKLHSRTFSYTELLACQANWQ